MSSLDLDQVLYARAGWRNAILFPLWAFQILVLLSLMGIFAYRLAETFEHYEELDKVGEVPIVEVVWEATNVGFNLIALILNILEIARKATERLTPFLMVCTHVIKLTLAFAVLALDIVAYLKHMDGHYSTIGLSLDCGLLAANIATFIYAITTYRRLLQYEDYHLTANAKAHGGFVPGGESLELGSHTTNKGGGIMATTTTELRYSASYDTSYPRQADPDTQYIRPLPAAAAGSTATAGPATTAAAAAGTTASPPPQDDLKTQVDRAMGYEFGWNTTSSNSNQETGVVDIDRSDSVVVGSGTVAARHGLVAGGPTLVAGGVGVQRQQSWATERGFVGEVEGEEAAHGVVMGRVGPAGGGGKGGREDDQEGLLGGR